MRRVVLASVLALFAAPTLAEGSGEQLFVDNCSACHQIGGIGQPGLAPPLVDEALWTGLGEHAERYIAGVFMGGLTGTIVANGQTYIGVAMPPQDWMSDEEMTAVVDYVLNELNDQDMGIDPDVFAQMREDRMSHSELRALRKDAIE